MPDDTAGYEPDEPNNRLEYGTYEHAQNERAEAGRGAAESSQDAARSEAADKEWVTEKGSSEIIISYEMILAGASVFEELEDSAPTLELVEAVYTAMESARRSDYFPATVETSQISDSSACSGDWQFRRDPKSSV